MSRLHWWLVVAAAQAHRGYWWLRDRPRRWWFRLVVCPARGRHREKFGSGGRCVDCLTVIGRPGVRG